MSCHPERAASVASGESRDLLLLRSDQAPALNNESANIKDCHPERSEAESRDPLLLESSTTLRSCRPRIARASSLLSGTANRDPLNRPWSVAESTFGDAIRRHEAQYAARAAAALAVGIEPPPYEPFTKGMIPPGNPDYEKEQQMQQHSSEYRAAHFRKQIAERPDFQQYLDEEVAESATANSGDFPPDGGLSPEN